MTFDEIPLQFHYGITFQNPIPRHDIAELLLSARADIEAKTLSTATQDLPEWTPLLFACYFADVDFVDMLIRKNADVGQTLHFRSVGVGADECMGGGGQTLSRRIVSKHRK